MVGRHNSTAGKDVGSQLGCLLLYDGSSNVPFPGITCLDWSTPAPGFPHWSPQSSLISPACHLLQPGFSMGFTWESTSSFSWLRDSEGRWSVETLHVGRYLYRLSYWSGTLVKCRAVDWTWFPTVLWSNCSQIRHLKSFKFLTVVSHSPNWVPWDVILFYTMIKELCPLCKESGDSLVRNDAFPAPLPRSRD